MSSHQRNAAMKASAAPGSPASARIWSGALCGEVQIEFVAARVGGKPASKAAPANSPQPTPSHGARTKSCSASSHASGLASA